MAYHKRFFTIREASDFFRVPENEIEDLLKKDALKGKRVSEKFLIDGNSLFRHYNNGFPKTKSRQQRPFPKPYPPARNGSSGFSSFRTYPHHWQGLNTRFSAAFPGAINQANSGPREFIAIMGILIAEAINFYCSAKGAEFLFDNQGVAWGLSLVIQLAILYALFQIKWEVNALLLVSYAFCFLLSVYSSYVFIFFESTSPVRDKQDYHLASQKIAKGFTEAKKFADKQLIAAKKELLAKQRNASLEDQFGVPGKRDPGKGFKYFNKETAAKSVELDVKTSQQEKDSLEKVAQNFYAKTKSQSDSQELRKAALEIPVQLPARLGEIFSVHALNSDFLGELNHQRALNALISTGQDALFHQALMALALASVSEFLALALGLMRAGFSFRFSFFASLRAKAVDFFGNILSFKRLPHEIKRREEQISAREKIDLEQNSFIDDLEAEGKFRQNFKNVAVKFKE